MSKCFLYFLVVFSIKTGQHAGVTNNSILATGKKEVFPVAHFPGIWFSSLQKHLRNANTLRRESRDCFFIQIMQTGIQVWREGKIAFLKDRRKPVLSSNNCVLVASGEARHTLLIQNKKVVQPARLHPVQSAVQQKKMGSFWMQKAVWTSSNC